MWIGFLIMDQSSNIQVIARIASSDTPNERASRARYFWLLLTVKSQYKLNAPQKKIWIDGLKLFAKEMGWFVKALENVSKALPAWTWHERKVKFIKSLQVTVFQRFSGSLSVYFDDIYSTLFLR